MPIRRNCFSIRAMSSVDNFCKNMHRDVKSGEAPAVADAAGRLAMKSNMKVRLFLIVVVHIDGELLSRLAEPAEELGKRFDVDDKHITAEAQEHRNEEGDDKHQDKRCESIAKELEDGDDSSNEI